MLIAALALNLLILIPVLIGLQAGGAGMDVPFGPDTHARRILTNVYAAIAVVSVGLIALHVTGHAWAVPMTVALFAVQITYKLGTVPMVGLSNPVVQTNLLVVVVQVLVLVALVVRGSLPGG